MSEPIEGTVIEPDRKPVTLLELITGLARFAKEHSGAAQLPVAFETHCCVMNLSGEDPEVVAPTLPSQREHVLIKLEDA